MIGYLCTTGVGNKATHGAAWGLVVDLVKKKAPTPRGVGAMNDSGSDLLSHQVTLAVPSALEDLTTEFGMGSGVAPPLQPPEIVKLNRTVHT